MNSIIVKDAKLECLSPLFPSGVYTLLGLILFIFLVKLNTLTRGFYNGGATKEGVPYNSTPLRILMDG